MFWTILTFLLLVLLGGFLSYYGDLQGRRWGKKRVSWFGLRPKHTAILITSLTGSFIVLLSIATVLLAVPAVREVALRGERAIRDNKRLNAQLEKERTDSNEQLRRSRLNLQSTEIRLDSLNADYKKICAQYEENKMRLAQLRGEWDKISREYTRLQKEKFRLARHLSAEQKQLALNKTENQRLERQNLQAGRLNLDLGKQNLKLASENAALNTQNLTLQAKNTDLSDRNMVLLRENDALTKAKEALERANQHELLANADTQKKKQELEARMVELQGQIRELTRRQEELYVELAGEKTTFVQTYNTLRQGRLCLRAGETLARRTFQAQMRPEAVQRELRALLDEASMMALRNGATRGANGRTVRIVSKRLVTLAGTQTADEEASLNALVDNLANNDRPVVVIATAVSNSVAGEQAIIELTSLEVRPTFRKGDIVARLVIDAAQPIEKVVEELVLFLQKEVRNAAIEAGTVPQVDPQTGAQEVGQFGPADLVRLTDQIRRKGGKVQLMAIAADDLYSSDPLRLTFRLSRPRP